MEQWPLSHSTFTVGCTTVDRSATRVTSPHLNLNSDPYTSNFVESSLITYNFLNYLTVEAVSALAILQVNMTTLLSVLEHEAFCLAGHGDLLLDFAEKLAYACKIITFRGHDLRDKSHELHQKEVDALLFDSPSISDGQDLEQVRTRIRREIQQATETLAIVENVRTGLLGLFDALQNIDRSQLPRPECLNVVSTCTEGAATSTISPNEENRRLHQDLTEEEHIDGGAGSPLNLSINYTSSKDSVQPDTDREVDPSAEVGAETDDSCCMGRRTSTSCSSLSEAETIYHDCSDARAPSFTSVKKPRKLGSVSNSALRHFILAKAERCAACSPGDSDGTAARSGSSPCVTAAIAEEKQRCKEDVLPD